MVIHRFHISDTEIQNIMQGSNVSYEDFSFKFIIPTEYIVDDYLFNSIQERKVITDKMSKMVQDNQVARLIKTAVENYRNLEKLKKDFIYTHGKIKI